MRENVFVGRSGRRDGWYAVSEVPDICPTCHVHCQPEQVFGMLEGTEHEGTIHAVYQCTRSVCRSLFFAEFTRSRSPDNYPDCFMYRGCGPWTPEKVSWPAEIEALSPRFVAVFASAIAAERLGLDDLVGMGLRKALEFLIKDYAISVHPNESDAIRRLKLSAVISKYCESEKLKISATRAVWLGNDETHYERIWVKQDVTDLKVLVRLAVGWIESELLTKHYKDEMPPNRPEE